MLPTQAGIIRDPEKLYNLSILLKSYYTGLGSFSAFLEGMMYVTTGHAARMLGVGLNTVKRWIQGGILRANCTPGGHWRISRDELTRFMRDQEVKKSETTESDSSRILIIDDDPMTCALYLALLESWRSSLSVHVVNDGYTGLMQLGALQPMLLILDILMPGMDGLEVLRRIRERTEHDHLVIVVITAVPDHPDLLRVMKSCGVAAVLPKPLEAQRFLDVVGTCLALSAHCRAKQAKGWIGKALAHG